MKKYMIYFISLITLILIWVSIYLIIDHPLLLPSPLDVSKKLISLLIHLDSISIILSTIFRLIISIAGASIFAISLGLIAGLYPKFAYFMKPYVTTLRTIPVISIVVIMLILLGFTWTPYVITFFMVFPIIYQATYQGVLDIEPELIDVMKLEKKHIYLMISQFYFPMIKPFIFLSFLQSFGLGIKVLVMAEYLAQTKNSIGHAIYFAKVNLAYDEIFAWTFILIVISIIIEMMIQRAMKQKDGYILKAKKQLESQKK